MNGHLHAVMPAPSREDSGPAVAAEVAVADGTSGCRASPSRAAAYHGEKCGLATLKARIARLERPALADGGVEAVATGVAVIDGHLPWGGMPRRAVHEVFAPLEAARNGPEAAAAMGPAAGFAVLLLARLARHDSGHGTASDMAGNDGLARAGTVLWVARGGRGGRNRHGGARSGMAGFSPYGPGLGAFGLDAGRLLLVRAASDREALWAVEEGLATPALAGVLAEVEEVDLTASRRLQLTAERGGVALLLRPPGLPPSPGAAVTRWRVGAAPPSPGAALVRNTEGARGVGPARWRVDLMRCRGGAPGGWFVEWCDATGDLALAAPVVDRPLGAPRFALAG